MSQKLNMWSKQPRASMVHITVITTADD